MTQNTKRCYGKFSTETSRCRNCVYHESCRFYTATGKSVDSLSGLVSFDNTVSEWLADEEHVPGCEEPENAAPQHHVLEELATLLRYLLSMDAYTLGIVADIIAPEDAPERTGSVSVGELARHRNCSRQAMHRKLLASVRRYPELASLFQTTLRKLGNAKSRFRCAGRTA